MLFPRRSFFLPLLALIAAAGLSACQDTPPAPAARSLSFAEMPPIGLDVARVDFVEEYKPSMRAPNVEHEMPMSPSEAMRQWAKDRIRASGQQRTLQIIIKNASVVASDLPKKDGLTGFFTDGQDKRYDAKLDVELRIYGDAALSEASIVASANRLVTISESATASERDAQFRKLIADLMNSINVELDRNINLHFARYRVL